MKKIVLILFVLLILVHNIIFASWTAKYDAEIVYLSTECTNDEAATFTIAVNEDECFMYIAFKSIILTSGYTKIECKFDDENATIITAQSSEKESILFSSARGDRDVERFIGYLSESKEFSIKINDEQKHPCIFTFDMSGLKEQFQNISSNKH